MNRTSEIPWRARPPRKERLREKNPDRYTEIIRMATQMLATVGYRDTNVNHLATQVGVGVGTLYNYFDDKDDLLLACVEAAAETDLKIKAARVDRDAPALQMLRTIVEVDHELLETDPAGQQLLKSVFYGINSHLPVSRSSRQFYLGSIELVEQALARGVEEGVIDLGGDLRLGALVVNGIMETFYVLGDLLPDSDTARGAGPALRALELVCHGILTQTGRAQLAGIVAGDHPPSKANS